MLDLRNKGINIILVAHSGKDISKGIRGASNVEDNVDIVIQLKDKKDGNTDNVCFEYNFTKCRFHAKYNIIKPRILEFKQEDNGRYQ